VVSGECLSAIGRKNLRVLWVRSVEVGHLDGHEENTEPENLIWNRRACNLRLGVVSSGIIGNAS
jgi:hypothetical protein